MAKKTNKTAQSRLQTAAKDLKDSGRRAWLAGLGVVATVDEAGRTAFQKLVTRGEKLQNESGAQLREAEARVKAMGRQVEKSVEARVAATLERFGMPARDEVQRLIGRIEHLTKKVEALTV